jgi:hypothetical protein
MKLQRYNWGEHLKSECEYRMKCDFCAKLKMSPLPQFCKNKASTFANSLNNPASGVGSGGAGGPGPLLYPEIFFHI